MLKSFVIIGVMLFSQVTMAESIVSETSTMHSLLKSLHGKNVELSLASGVKYGGKIGVISGSMVEIKALRGKEFYDAFVEIDDISAIVKRNR